MLLANYDSDSDGSASEGESSRRPAVSVIPAARPTALPATAKPAAAAAPKKKGPIKITLDLPKPGASHDDEREAGASSSAKHPEEDEYEGREVKKPKLSGIGGPKGGAGSSSLLGMLPAPKRKLPSASSPKSSLAVNKSMATKPVAPADDVPAELAELRASLGSGVSAGGGGGDGGEDDAGHAGLLPPSLRAKTKKSESAELDLFGLSSAPTPKSAASSSTSKIKPPTITSAPSVADFVPPAPTAADPYPGYYQLPGGQWAAYDPEYYASFFSTDEHGADSAGKKKGEDGRVGHHWDELDDGRGEVVDVDVSAGIREAREQEERKAKMAKPKLPGDEYQYKAIGQTKGLAAERHQLTSLLNTAFTQREALEERIAQNKKNMRLAGTKYGF